MSWKALGYDPFPYKRDSWYDFTGRIGGPIVRDKAWFYASTGIIRDKDWQPGVDNTVNGSDTYKAERLNVKSTYGSARSTSSDGCSTSTIGIRSAVATPSPPLPAAAVERGITYGYGANLTSTLSPNTLLEVRYAGWWADDISDSPTGSMEEPFIDWTPPGGGPPTYSGGVSWPWDYITWSQQFKGKVTHYTENFLNAQHEFKFGVQVARGDAKTNVAPGPNGSYTYRYYGYYYQAISDPLPIRRDLLGHGHFLG